MKPQAWVPGNLQFFALCACGNKQCINNRYQATVLLGLLVIMGKN